MAQGRIGSLSGQVILTESDPGAQIAGLTVQVLSAFTPDAPANVAAEAQSSSAILVTWDDVDGETAYRVERRPC